MRYKEYSYRHGKELLQSLKPVILNDTKRLLDDLVPFPHGKRKFATAKE